MRRRLLNSLIVQSISFDTFRQLRQRSDAPLDWHCLFVFPFWLDAVVRHLDKTREHLLLGVYHQDHPVGVAPLARQGAMVRFLGIGDVCDYQDIISAKDLHLDVVAAIANHLRDAGFRTMELGTLRPDSKMLQALRQLAEQDDLSLSIDQTDVTYETDLPESWEAYLQQLGGKQRHEVRRKIRRLEAAGRIGFTTAGTDTLEDHIERFMTLFRSNRKDKADFMTTTMEGYFRQLAHTLSERNLLRLHLLTVDGEAAAGVFCFDHNRVRYLYNSGYDERFKPLSVGVLSKVFSIQKAIEAGCRHYDFLRGAETYKKRIGGQEVPLYQCRLEL
jgi:CelD/BcsL family acetyltransferase involved in cellulose biosynthesis